MRSFVTCAVAVTLMGAVGIAAAAELPSWVRPASGADLSLALAKTADEGGAKMPPQVRRPAVLLETDYYYYPYSGGDRPTVYATIDAAGYGMPVTMWLYWQNRATGERRYLNQRAGLLQAGNARDLFGTASSPLAMYAPTIADVVLLGNGGALGQAPLDPTGQYEFVLELRDATGAKVVSEDHAMYNFVDGVTTVTGSIVDDTVWTNDHAYLLDSAPVYVGGNPITNNPPVTPTVLTIEAGTVILGSTANQGTLVVTRGSDIYANGTPNLPIIFSSVQPRGSRAAGDWGGLVLNGAAPLNDPTIYDNPEAGEGDSGPFGGDDPNDSSGALNYVRVEFAGIRFSDRNELNGIALQGVGAGTVVNNVQVSYNLDDGIEFFGGTVNVTNVFIYGARDDSVDWVLGWRGQLDNVVVIQLEDADCGIEADNLGDGGEDNEPRSNPTIRNATFVGLKGVAGVENGSGARLRRGTAGTLRGAIFQSFGHSGIRVEGTETFDQITAGTLVMANSIIYDNGVPYAGDDEAAVAAWLESASAANLFENPMLADPFNPVKPDVTPLAGSKAADARYAGTLDYIGGVDPNASWINAGWISYSKN
jgi:hypothetical protein